MIRINGILKEIHIAFFILHLQNYHYFQIFGKMMMDGKELNFLPFMPKNY